MRKSLHFDFDRVQGLSHVDGSGSTKGSRNEINHDIFGAALVASPHFDGSFVN